MSDINVAKNPKDIINDGTKIYYICGKCGVKFKASQRCPECGQLVEIDNDDNDDAIYTIHEIEKLFDEYGITYNDQIKGNYRIMGKSKGSSLNLNKKNYVIYTSDFDYEKIVNKQFDFDDLELEKNGNMRDGSRTNVVKCKKRSTLKALLKVYAQNAENKL